MDRKPLIGVPACRRMLEPHPFHMAGEKYLTALVDGADALPVIIPSLAGDIDAAAVIAQVDGILLTGSPSNVEPRHYEGETSAPGTLHDPHRDAMTLPVARSALANGVPLLAICRGLQELNVVLGGTLHQDIGNTEGLNSHRENPDDSLDRQYGPAHPVNLVEGGYLHGLIGEDRIDVNSLHNQGIRKLASGVTIEAVAEDGLVEAFTVDDASAFALAVQWHPEWRVTENSVSMKIFQAFGDACRARAAGRQV